MQATLYTASDYSAPGPVSGLRVLETGGGGAEACGRLLAGLGAEVVKLEPPLGGSPSRAIGPFLSNDGHAEHSLFFWYYNQNKRSVTLDLDTPSGQHLFRQLATTVDVVLDGNVPGYLNKRGCGYELLRELNRALIVCAVSPFGQDGPYAWMQGGDLIEMAMGGVLWLCGYDDHAIPPIRGEGWHAMNAAGIWALNAVLASLVSQRLSGSDAGDLIDVSAQACLAISQEEGFSWYAFNKENVQRQTGRHAKPHLSTEAQVQCSDGQWLQAGNVLAAATSFNAWNDFGKVRDWIRPLQPDSPILDPVFDDMEYRMAHPAEASSLIRLFIESMPADVVYRTAQERGLTIAHIREPEHVLNDGHLQDREFFISYEDPGAGVTVRSPGAPFKMSATPWSVRRPAPGLGEHTAEILRDWLGCTDADVLAFRSVRAI